jgi:hypothetical protein
MRRRITMIAGGIAVATIIVVTAAWFFFVQQTQRAIDQWADAQRTNGVDVTWQSLRFTGYPLRIDARIGEPQMIVRQPNRMVIWKPSLLTFKFSSIAPRAIDFVSPGAHDIHATFEDATWSAVVDAETLEGQALFPPGDYRRIEQLAGRFSGVRMTPHAWADPVTVEQGTFEAARRAATPVNPQAVHPQGVSFALELAARDISLPKDLLTASALETLGPLVSELSTEVLITGELDTGSVDTDALRTWRDGGGTVEITSIDLLWGPVRFTANGTLALDGDLQPVGSFATQIAGLEKFVTAMETDGILSPSDAAIARVTLSILTRSSDDGGPNRAEIPITLQDRILRLGPVALIQFPPIVWE